MDLPRFAVVMRDENGFTLMTMEGLMTYEQGRAALLRHRSNGYDQCYLVAVTFIAGPQTDLDE